MSPLEATLSIRQRGVALFAALMIVGVVVLGSVSAASAQSDYKPSTESSSIAPSSSSHASGAATPLPRTGSNSTVPMTQLGVLLVVAGGFLVIVARKRSHRERVTVDA
jgi:LPXTG-motif cell wall-anchored protein